MATTLIDRADMRAAFYKQLATDSNDPALAEHYASADEAANGFLQRGIESAQFHILDHVDPGRWLKRQAISAWTTDAHGDYITLPTDFLRLADSGDGDKYVSPIIRSDYSRWGKQVEFADRHRFERASVFYLSNGRLVLARLAPTSPGTGGWLEYHYSHAVLASDATAIEIAEPDRWLAVAFACWHAAQQPWVALDAEGKQEVGNFLAYWQDEVGRRSRRSHSPPRFRGRRVLHPNRIRS